MRRSSSRAVRTRASDPYHHGQCLWGIVGMLLATPLTAIMKILFERLELTAPIADLLAGRLDHLRSA